MMCPHCKSTVTELIECDRCSEIGCVRCVSKSGKEWFCTACKNFKAEESSQQDAAQSAFASMFG